MAYIPPALRKRAQGSASDGKLGITAEAAGSQDDLPPDAALRKSVAGLTFPYADIHHHYWAPQNVEDHRSTTFAGSAYSTLNSSAQALDKLKYIMLFRGANPRWKSHGIIFVKSKLHILPGGEGFKDDQQPEISRILPEQSRDMVYERSTSAKEKESLTENEGHGNEFLVNESQCVGKERQECDEKGEPSEGIEKNGGGSTESDRYAGTLPSDHAHVSRTKATSQDSDEDYDPDPAAPYCPDLSLYDIEPIAVFEQLSSQQRGQFRFTDYYKIASLEFLAPRSRELFQLLEQKFNQVDRFGHAKQKQRSAAKWKDSMRHRWAVISMEKDQDANNSLPPPKIEARNNRAGDDDASSPKKSVNELLKEMRMNG